MQRLKRHNQLRGRAVRVRDDVALSVSINRIRVHFRHDQRNVGLHPVERGIVDHDAARCCGFRRVFLSRARACGEQGDIPTGPIEMLDILAFEHLAGVTEFHFGAL